MATGEPTPTKESSAKSSRDRVADALAIINAADSLLKRRIPEWLYKLLQALAAFYFGFYSWVLLPAVPKATWWVLGVTWYISVANLIVITFWILLIRVPRSTQREWRSELGVFLLAISGLLGGFAQTYLAISLHNPQAFSEPLNPISATYLSVGTFATTGAGAITAMSDLSRFVVVIQTIIDFMIIALAVSVVIASRPPIHPDRHRQ
jgi:hypothetical protein